ncbi:hypothetical protein [Paenibacillus sp. S150]|uniref:hypothetical protein n=1 Tax=Paenibacillus sp. S150 TaxID=2749826 RepID=UPI001C595956|nr:hypothetical protein [Paenibacillus sp. S150]MBW4082936.1 hypothetical protein [Paenibacillus sp. S150]
MALEFDELMQHFSSGVSIEFEKMGKKHVLVTVEFIYEKPKKYYGRYIWRFYDKGAPFTIYFNRVRYSGFRDELILSSEITFFVEELIENNNILSRDIEINSGFPTFKLKDLELMRDELSFEEKGELIAILKGDYLICSLRSTEYDKVVHFEDNVSFIFSNNLFAGVIIRLNEQQRTLLQKELLI